MERKEKIVIHHIRFLLIFGYYELITLKNEEKTKKKCYKHCNNGNINKIDRQTDWHRAFGVYVLSSKFPKLKKTEKKTKLKLFSSTSGKKNR